MSLKKGAKQAVINCMRINRADKVTIITDEKTKKVADSIKAECLTITPNVNQLILENYGVRPLKSLPDEIKKLVSDSTAVFYMARSLPGEKTSLRMPIVNYGVRKGKARQAHMPDITAEIMKQGMNTNYRIVKKLSKKIYNIVKKAKKITVITKKGTNIVITFNPKWKWIIADGDIANAKTGWSNLPDGEVFTAPLSVNGHVVVDGCVGDYFIKEKLKTPIYIDIKKTRVVSIKTKNKKLQKDLLKYIKQDKNASRIGEFAIGTNVGLKKIIGNLLQDEKFPGIHFAVGDSYPNETKAPFPSKAHCDFVVTKTTIFVEGKCIMKNGKFII